MMIPPFLYYVMNKTNWYNDQLFKMFSYRPVVSHVSIGCNSLNLFIDGIGLRTRGAYYVIHWWNQRICKSSKWLRTDNQIFWLYFCLFFRTKFSVLLSASQCVIRTVRPTYSASYVQCVLRTVRPTYSAFYVQCVLRTVRSTYSAFYVQCVLRTVSSTYSAFSVQCVLCTSFRCISFSLFLGHKIWGIPDPNL